MIFRDRVEAGKKLASALAKYRSEADIVLSIPNGGAICGSSVAREFNLPHDLIFVNKIYHPNFKDFIVGAINEKGEWFLKSESSSLEEQWLDDELEKKKKEIKKKRHEFLTNHPSIPLRGKKVIIIDDGLSEHVVGLAAIAYLRAHEVLKIYFGAPVGSTTAFSELKPKLDGLAITHIVDGSFDHNSYYEKKEVNEGELIKLIASAV